jgi:hypothetical protein
MTSTQTIAKPIDNTPITENKMEQSEISIDTFPEFESSDEISGIVESNSYPKHIENEMVKLISFLQIPNHTIDSFWDVVIPDSWWEKQDIFEQYGRTWMYNGQHTDLYFIPTVSKIVLNLDLSLNFIEYFIDELDKAFIYRYFVLSEDFIETYYLDDVVTFNLVLQWQEVCDEFKERYKTIIKPVIENRFENEFKLRIPA